MTFWLLLAYDAVIAWFGLRLIFAAVRMRGRKGD